MWLAGPRTGFGGVGVEAPRPFPSPAAVAAHVAKYDAKHGHLDARAWSLSLAARPLLFNRECGPELVDFVWYIAKTWGRVLGIVTDVREAAVSTLLQMQWSESHFETYVPAGLQDQILAVCAVSALVDGLKERGIRRREFSASSKVLHWLMPWRVPIYDDRVRKALGLPLGPDDPSTATYREIVRWEFGAVQRLNQSGDLWMGQQPPHAELRGLDKYLWLPDGGGSSCST